MPVTISTAEHELPAKEGKAAAASALRVAGVSPILLNASSRIPTPGSPPLLVEPVGCDSCGDDPSGGVVLQD